MSLFFDCSPALFDCRSAVCAGARRPRLRPFARRVLPVSFQAWVGPSLRAVPPETRVVGVRSYGLRSRPDHAMSVNYLVWPRGKEG